MFNLVQSLQQDSGPICRVYLMVFGKKANRNAIVPTTARKRANDQKRIGEIGPLRVGQRGTNTTSDDLIVVYGICVTRGWRWLV